MEITYHLYWTRIMDISTRGDGGLHQNLIAPGRKTNSDGSGCDYHEILSLAGIRIDKGRGVCVLRNSYWCRKHHFTPEKCECYTSAPLGRIFSFGVWRMHSLIHSEFTGMHSRNLSGVPSSGWKRCIQSLWWDFGKWLQNKYFVYRLSKDQYIIKVLRVQSAWNYTPPGDEKESAIESFLRRALCGEMNCIEMTELGNWKFCRKGQPPLFDGVGLHSKIFFELLSPLARYVDLCDSQPEMRGLSFFTSEGFINYSKTKSGRNDFYRNDPAIGGYVSTLLF